MGKQVLGKGVPGEKGTPFVVLALELMFQFRNRSHICIDDVHLRAKLRAGCSEVVTLMGPLRED